ncbi:hypothetical protein FA13DRAFT_1711871 [Coprinellus micaceus]|uniref:Uncharacterized protein n=1 Tax=Coprinellus micaceus TaxID=71717 RepID=A0A4Y7T2B4_COPMI|nr:hypothetical protein FA13DRAFT_1711871 [Coprinellus micaceus]
MAQLATSLPLTDSWMTRAELAGCLITVYLAFFDLLTCPRLEVRNVPTLEVNGLAVELFREVAGATNWRRRHITWKTKATGVFFLRRGSRSRPFGGMSAKLLQVVNFSLGSLVEESAIFTLKQPRGYHKRLTEGTFRRDSFSLWLLIVRLTMGVAKCCSFQLISLAENGIAIFQECICQEVGERWRVVEGTGACQEVSLPTPAQYRQLVVTIPFLKRGSASSQPMPYATPKCQLTKHTQRPLLDQQAVKLPRIRRKKVIEEAKRRHKDLVGLREPHVTACGVPHYGMNLESATLFKKDTPTRSLSACRTSPLLTIGSSPNDRGFSESSTAQLRPWPVSQSKITKAPELRTISAGGPRDPLGRLTLPLIIHIPVRRYPLVSEKKPTDNRMSGWRQDEKNRSDERREECGVAGDEVCTSRTSCWNKTVHPRCPKYAAQIYAGLAEKLEQRYGHSLERRAEGFIYRAEGQLGMQISGKILAAGGSRGRSGRLGQWCPKNRPFEANRFDRGNPKRRGPEGFILRGSPEATSNRPRRGQGLEWEQWMRRHGYGEPVGHWKEEEADWDKTRQYRPVGDDLTRRSESG